MLRVALHLPSPVRPGGDAEQVDRKAGLPVAQGPRGDRAGHVEFVARLQLQGVVEGAHDSHRQTPEHLLQDLLRQVQTGPRPGGLLPYATHRDHPAQQQHGQVQQQEEADAARHPSLRVKIARCCAKMGKYKLSQRVASQFFPSLVRGDT